MSDTPPNEDDDQIHDQSSPAVEPVIAEPDVPAEEEVDVAALGEVPAEEADAAGDEEEPAEDEIVEDTKRNLDTDVALRLLPNQELGTLCETLIQNIILNDQPQEANISMESEFIDHYLVFASEFSQGGIVKTPKHIAELMCDLAELDENSKVLDITCGTGTFLSAAFENIKGKIPPNDIPTITENFAGFDNNAYMAGITKNIFQLHGIDHLNVRKIDCFSDEAEEFAEEFEPDVILCNPPHTKDGGQDKEPLEFLKRACELCHRNGKVFALMPIANDTLVRRTKSAKQKALREELLRNHRLLATMEMDRQIFKIDPTGSISSNPSAIVVMEPHTNGGHNPEHDVWMAMWRNDGRRFVNGTGRIVNPRNIRTYGESVWQQMRQQWKWAFINRNNISLIRTPTPGQEPLFGASYNTKLEFVEGNWTGDWIATAGIPSPITDEAKEEQLHRMNEAWEEYWKYSLLMR